MENKNKRGIYFSLALHIILFISTLTLHSVNIMVPSRSDGMEVELVTPTELTKQRNMPAKPIKYQVQNTNNADVKLKQPDTTPVPPVPPVEPSQPKATPKPKKPAPNQQITDLLNDIAPSKGNSKGVATGGSNLGTSDTNNTQANYADLVIARIRPYVIIPDGIDPNAKVVVEVTLLPNMQVYNIKLVKSSGNDDYDNNIQQSINRVQVFPPLLDGADFNDYRKIRLTFKPQ